MNNYSTKYHSNQRVLIASGFHKGKIGKILNYTPSLTRGFVEDNSSRGINSNTGLYEVKLSFFKTVLCEENQLLAVPKKVSP